jgi:hypothetical protein
VPVTVITAQIVVPEPTGDRKAQLAHLTWLNDLADKIEAEAAAHRGIAKVTHVSKQSPGKRDLTPPPTKPAPAGETDMVTLAEIGAGVAAAADVTTKIVPGAPSLSVEPIAGTAPKHKAA